MWVKGRHERLRYEAKVYPVPSARGIDGGRVSKLEIYAPSYRFDRGDVDTLPDVVTPEHIAAIVQDAERQTSWWRHFQGVAQWANQRVDGARLVHRACVWLLRLLVSALTFVFSAVLFTSPDTPVIFAESRGESPLMVWMAMYLAVVICTGITEWIVWELEDDAGS